MSAQPPSATLYLATGCPHCPVVLQGLSELVKQGKLGTLEVINIQARPDLAARAGVRSVPWFRIGPIELEGLHSPAELKEWVALAGRPDAVAEYLARLLRDGQLGKAEAYLRRHPGAMPAVLDLLERKEAELPERLGVNALMESLEGSEALAGLIDRLTELSRHPDPRIRGDATWFLGLTHDPRARPAIEARLEDENPDVREVAEDALERLQASADPA
ncbi:MAG TPA: HEAT repeat domain-containing protein [Thiotrichales bacterium]|nr:HEAT repeat domain-containing protein [Thiotrichales bacterium]